MEIVMVIFLVVVLALTAWTILIYNRLVRLKHNVGMAWSNIDVLLKQRHEELPKLVETCKQYMKYEQATLEKIMEARSAVAQARQAQDMAALGQAETRLRLGLGYLFAVAEDYPELRANDNFRHLESRITGLENAIADRREFYNASVNLNNVRIDQFPELVVARLFDFRPYSLLEITEEDRPEVNIREPSNS